jgi:Cu/Ag efflux pump CusA
MRSDLDAFGDIPIVTANHEYVPLAEVAELNFSPYPARAVEKTSNDASK